MSENGYVSSRSPSHASERSVHTPAKSAASKKSRSPSRSYSRSRSRSAPRYHRTSRRKRSYSRSRSRSHRRYSKSRSRSPRRHKSHRSRSRSREVHDRRDKYYSDTSYGRRKSRSRSPMSTRRRHFGDRDNPEPTKCLGVFGLSLYTQERDLRDVFGRYGSVEECNIVYDRQSGQSRGFAFLYFRNMDDSIEAKDRCTGVEIDGHKIRVDYSITKRAHTPTPGIYLGRPVPEGSDDRHSRSSRGYGGGGGGGGGGYSRDRRSPSPYYSRGRRGGGGGGGGRYYSRSRSRSRSYTPRRY